MYKFHIYLQNFIDMLNFYVPSKHRVLAKARMPSIFSIYYSIVKSIQDLLVLQDVICIGIMECIAARKCLGHRKTLFYYHDSEYL